MSKKTKYAFFNRTIADVSAEIKQAYLNKAYNLWMSKFKWNGLDEELSERQENYIMRKFWCDGTVACRQTRDMLVFAPYAIYEYDMYDYPASVTLVNMRGVSSTLIPTAPQVVNKDVVIGYAQPNHKSIASVASYYIDRIVQVELVINTNLQLQKMPWLVGVTPEDKEKMEDIIAKLLANEVVIFADLEDLSKVQTLATTTPYIIDKLEAHRDNLWNELLSYIGVDNIGHEKGERLIVDEANANNDMINAYGSAIEDEIKKMLETVNRVFGRQVSIEPKIKPITSVSEASDSNGGMQSGEAKSQEGTGEQ